MKNLKTAVKKIFKFFAIFLGSLILLGIILWIYVWIRTNFFPGQDIDVSEISDPLFIEKKVEIPEEKLFNNNAYPYLKKIHSNLNKNSRKKIKNVRNKVKSGNYNLAQVDAILNENKTNLVLLNKAFTKDYFVSPILKNDSESEVVDSPVLTFLEVNSLVYLKFVSELDHQKYHDAITNLTNYFNLLEKYSKDPNLSLVMPIAVNTEKKMLSPLLNLIIKNQEKFTTEEVKQLIQAVAKTNDLTDIYQRGILSEYHFSTEIFNNLDEEIKLAHGYSMEKNIFLYKPNKTIKRMQNIFKIHLSHAKTCQNYDDYLVKLEQEKNINSNNVLYILARSSLQENGIGNFATEISITSFKGYFERKCIAETQSNYQTINLAIIAYNKENNKNPAKLSDLVPNYLPKIPISNYSHAPYIYDNKKLTIHNGDSSSDPYKLEI